MGRGLCRCRACSEALNVHCGRWLAWSPGCSCRGCAYWVGDRLRKWGLSCGIRYGRLPCGTGLYLRGLAAQAGPEVPAHSGGDP